MGVRETDNLFQHRYYRINKMLLQLTGQWPYQGTRSRFVLLVLQSLIATSVYVPLVIATVKHIDDWYIFVECVLPLTAASFSITKICLSTFKTKKMLKLLDRMNADWKVLARCGDVDSLHEYAEMARKMTIVYTVTGYIGGALFAIQPVVPKIIDVLLRNGTEPGEFPIPLDYAVIDEQKYYFYIFLQYCVVLSIGLTIVIAHDLLFLVCVQHGCGLYATLGHKLERIGKHKRSIKSNEVAHALDERKMDVTDLASCIDRHNHAIEHAELIEEIYSWNILLIVVLNSVLITISGLEIFMRTIEPQKALRFVMCSIIVVMHLFVECYLGQILMDHSVSIRNCIFNSGWYTLPAKAQTVLVTMMMRCNVPCKITAAKIAILSIENFNAILNTSMSYIMVLRSI